MSDTSSRFGIKPEHGEFATTLASLLTREFLVGAGVRSVIAIAGESGSGKSVTASGLAHALSAMRVSVEVLHQDDYFIRPPRANHDHRTQDLASVGPHEVNLDLIRAHIAAFRLGAVISAPVTDRPGDRFLARPLDFANLSTLIVEGTYVLRLSDSDVRVFLEATSDETRERRRLRNRDIDAPIVDQVLAIEHALIAPQVALAHLVIDRDFSVRRQHTTRHP